MNIIKAMQQQSAIPDSVLYWLAKPDRLINYNPRADRFYAYVVTSRRGDFDRACYAGRTALTPTDVLAKDWQVRVEPFVVEE